MTTQPMAPPRLMTVAAATSEPLLVVPDDLQWATPTSVRSLAYLPGWRPAGPPARAGPD